MQPDQPSSGLTAAFTFAGAVSGGIYGALSAGTVGAALFAPFGLAVGYLLGGSLDMTRFHSRKSRLAVPPPKTPDKPEHNQM